MPYKGGDLDLRLAGPVFSREAAPAAELAFGAAWSRSMAGLPHPIAVDELLLACCNSAYDIVRFHGSGDVRLEHLLHALTRVPAAVVVLRDLGIRADALRRETAVAIAAEMPASPIDRDSAPRSSAALEDALRRAAAEAERRRVPACLHDLLRVLLGAGPESPAAHMLMRAAADPPRLERWRDEPRQEALVAPPARHAEAQARALSPSAGDALLDRLDRMEARFSTLREEIAADGAATRDLLRAIQAELQTLRAEGARASDGGRSESAAVDAVLEAKLGEFGRAMAALAQRLGAIDKLAAGDNWQALSGRLEVIEGHIAGQTKDLASALTSALSRRLQEHTEKHLQTAGAQQIALETSVRAQLRKAEEAGKAREAELEEIHNALAQLGASQETLADSLAAWRAENGGDIGIVSNRLQQLEHTALDLLDRLNSEVQALRHDHFESEARRGNGLKRWLYGTGNVFAAGWRDEAALDRSRSGDKS